MLAPVTHKDGFIDVGWDDYNALDAVRSSWLQAMHRSPAACKLMMDGGDGRDTKALRMGRALHSVVLEPLSGNVILKNWDGRTKEGKAIAAGIDPDAIVLSRDEHDDVTGMAASLRSHPMIRTLLSQATMMEQAVLWTRDGRRCKAQLDVGHEDWIGDIKSTTSLSRFSPWSMMDYGYHRQAAWYLSAYTYLKLPAPKNFYYFVVASTAPYESAVFRLENESLASGIDETNALFTQFLQCEKDESWPRHTTSLLVAKIFPPRQEQTTTPTSP